MSFPALQFPLRCRREFLHEAVLPHERFDVLQLGRQEVREVSTPVSGDDHDVFIADVKTLFRHAQLRIDEKTWPGFNGPKA
jgi:hypothetical protein